MDHTLRGERMVKAMKLVVDAERQTGFKLNRPHRAEDRLILDMAISERYGKEMLNLLGLRHIPALSDLLHRGTMMQAWDEDRIEVGLVIADHLPQFVWKVDNYNLFRRERLDDNRMRLMWVTPEVILPTEVHQDWYYLAFKNELEYVNRYGQFPKRVRVSRPRDQSVVVEIDRTEWVVESL